jgi:hypothetical protein
VKIRQAQWIVQCIIKRLCSESLFSHFMPHLPFSQMLWWQDPNYVTFNLYRHRLLSNYGILNGFINIWWGFSCCLFFEDYETKVKWINYYLSPFLTPASIINLSINYYNNFARSHLVLLFRCQLSSFVLELLSLWHHLIAQWFYRLFSRTRNSSNCPLPVNVWNCVVSHPHDVTCGVSRQRLGNEMTFALIWCLWYLEGVKY